nr:HigA family addiction module antitoxin [Rubrivivax sp. JA1055]
MKMFNPPHPGETLREDVLPALGQSVTQAADALGVSRAALSRVINCRAAVSPEMALRLERWLGAEHGGSADVWMRMQVAHDLARAEKAARAVIRRIKPLPAASFDGAAAS